MQTTALKFRLYPTPAQETLLCATLETCRQVYNSFLHQRKHDCEVCGTSLSCYEQQKALPLWKKAHPELRAVFSQVLQNAAVRVALAFDAFFRRVKSGETPGYPRFKGRGQYDSITYPQSGFAREEQSVSLSKIGTVKAVIHRAIEGKVKTCTVRRQGDKWYVCFSVEVEPQPLPESTQQVGIDVGLEHFAVTDDEQFVANPRFFRKDCAALAKAQRKFEKVKHQPRRKVRQKAQKVVRRIHERIRNRRHDFVHQLARKLVNRYGLIAVEELSVKNMMATPKAKPAPSPPGEFLPNGASRQAGLNKSIADAAWRLFRQILVSKAERANRHVALVNPAYTSQTCSGCGHRVPKALSERVYSCPCCRLVLNRDVNAARNIKKIAVGLHSVPARQERSHVDLSAVE